jgi:hypothetical protein
VRRGADVGKVTAVINLAGKIACTILTVGVVGYKLHQASLRNREPTEKSFRFVKTMIKKISKRSCCSSTTTKTTTTKTTTKTTKKYSKRQNQHKTIGE